MTPEAIMTRTRTRLLLDHPWFGSLAMRLTMEPHAGTKTVETNGSLIRYNPEFVAAQTDAHMQAIMAHEVLHCALLHPYRRGTRDAQQWNRAADYVINLDLQAAGFQLPPDALLDPQYAGLSADVVYAKLGADPQPPPQPNAEPLSTGTCEDAPAQPNGGTPGAGDGQPDGQTASQPNGQPGNAPGTQQGMTAEDWQIAAEQATAVTRAAGSTPGDAVRSTKAARQNPEDWRAVLREFIEHQTPADYSWASPNRRFIADGLYLPGVVKENLGTIGVAVDTSGSVSPAVLAAFTAELQALLSEAQPEAVHVVYADSAVRGTQEFSPDDVEIDLNAKGGGGTRFNPALQHFAKMEQPPAAVLYFTDLENGGEQVTEPEFPVLWVTGRNVTKAQPFGPCVRIDAHV